MELKLFVVDEHDTLVHVTSAETNNAVPVQLQQAILVADEEEQVNLDFEVNQFIQDTRSTDTAICVLVEPSNQLTEAWVEAKLREQGPFDMDEEEF